MNACEHEKLETVILKPNEGWKDSYFVIQVL